MLTEQGTLPKWMLKEGEIVVVCSSTGRDVGTVPELEARELL